MSQAAANAALAPLQATLAAWRAHGAWRLDPARFHYLEAISRRLAAQPEPVRRLLHDRLQQALADYAARLTAHQQRGAIEAGGAAGATPLAQLNRDIRAAGAARRAAIGPGEPPEHDELASVRRFRLAWCASRSQAQFAQAAARLPANAGPLNSHALVLQSLALMRTLSPAYLRHFIAHVESLQWLDEAGAPAPRVQGRPSKAAAPPARGGRKK